MRKASIAFLAAALLLGGCSRPESAETGSREEPSASDRVPAAQSPAESRPWYAERFEALGFYVFDMPEELPPFTVQSRNGGADVRLEDFRGKITLLNFWATWCPPCRQEMPSLEVLHKALAGEAFQIAAVSVQETSATVEAFLERNPYTYPIYLDPEGRASAYFASRGIPTTLVLDKEGRALAAIIGSRSYAESEVVDLLRELARR